MRSKGSTECRLVSIHDKSSWYAKRDTKRICHHIQNLDIGNLTCLRSFYVDFGRAKRILSGAFTSQNRRRMGRHDARKLSYGVYTLSLGIASWARKETRGHKTLCNGDVTCAWLRGMVLMMNDMT